jgi:hypothetical protein
MLKHSVQLEIVKDDRVYQLSLPNNCPLGEVHDVLFQMRSYIVDRINEAQKQDQPLQPSPPVTDEAK